MTLIHSLVRVFMVACLASLMVAVVGPMFRSMDAVSKGYERTAFVMNMLSLATTCAVVYELRHDALTCGELGAMVVCAVIGAVVCMADH